ncbi:Glutathione reductase [Listeria monocytogenes N53-1]|nr:Glutathione reductase [Listeria monocytogenes]CCQ23444.1 Glutathione reductase [Listeria monocytogenes N53-1]
MAVVGAGYIAVELAGVLQQLGSETHLFVRKHAPLRNFDPLLTDTLTEIIEQSDMTLHKHAIPQKVEKNPDGSLTLSLEDGRTETVDTLIWAIGRKPVIKDLQIENISP